MKDLILNPLLTSRNRLMVMSALIAAPGGMDFMALLNTLSLTRGNLSAQLKKLEDGGMIEVKKEFIDRKPKSTHKCTSRGKKEVKAYLQTVERMLKGM